MSLTQVSPPTRSAPLPSPTIGSSLRDVAPVRRQETDLFLAVFVRKHQGSWALTGYLGGQVSVIASGAWTRQHEGWFESKTAELEAVIEQARSVCPNMNLMIKENVSGTPITPVGKWRAEMSQRQPVAVKDHTMIRVATVECERLLVPETLVTKKVYTDGSARRHGSSGGAAWVDTDGYFDAFPVRSGQPGVTEVAAIISALNNLQPDTGKVIIHTDSREAIRVMEDAFDGWGSVNKHRGLSAAVELTKRRGIEVEYKWVRSHAGDRFNECADRLAVLARRCHDAGLGERDIRARGRDIVEETMGGVSLVAA